MSTKQINPKYIVCDLDGCLIDTSWIWEVVNAYKMTKDEGFDVFNKLANAERNKIDMTLFKYLCFKASGGLKLHFLTARSELIEVETINFLQKKLGLIYGKEFTISSRPTTDVSTPAESKAVRVQAMLDAGKEIAFAIDDEDDILRMYLSKGIPVIKWMIGYIPTAIAQEFGSQFMDIFNPKEAQCQN